VLPADHSSSAGSPPSGIQFGRQHSLGVSASAMSSIAAARAALIDLGQQSPRASRGIDVVVQAVCGAVVGRVVQDLRRGVGRVVCRAPYLEHIDALHGN
jgi:hypothetical protein